MARKTRGVNSTELSRLQQRRDVKKALQELPVPVFNFKKIYGEGGDKSLTILTEALQRLQSKINLIYYGDKTKKNKGIKFPFKKEKINGILPIMVEINSIDFCNLINYILNNIPLDENSGSFRTVSLLKEKARSTLQLIDEILLIGNPNNQIEIGDIIVLNEDIPEITTKNFRGEETVYNFNFKINVDESNIKVLRKYPNSYTKTNNKAKEVLIKLRNAIQEISSITNDPDLIELIPKLSQNNNFITDYLKKLDKSIVLEEIPNEDLRKILTKLRDLRTILSLIVGIQSFRDALGAVQTATGLNIDREIQRVQKSLDFSVIIPGIKFLVKLLNIINQIGLQLLKIIRVISIYVKVQLVILKIFRKIIKVFGKLPLPLKFLMFGKASKLFDTKNKALAEIDRRLKVVRGYNTLLEAINFVIQDIIIKYQYINKQLQILETNLQICENTNNSPILDEITSVRKKIIKNIEELEKYSDRFDPELNPNLNTFGPFKLLIQEEEIVDEEIKYKRRRGIALDFNDILVEQTDLTFATDTNIILEELKLKLTNRGLVPSLDQTSTGFPDLDTLIEDITLDEDIPEVEDEDEEADKEYVEIQNELNTVIDSIKGAAKLKRRVRQNISQEAKKLNDDIREGNTEGVQLPGSATSSITSSVKAIDTGVETTSTNSDILSDEERKKLQVDLERYKKLRSDLVRLISSPGTQGTPGGNVLNNFTYKKYTNIIKQIESKLDKDTKARLAGG